MNTTITSEILTDDTLVTRSTTEIVLCGMLLGSIIILSLLGNIAVIYAVCTSHMLRDSHSNWFIINLSVTDLSNAIFVMCPAFVMLVADLKKVGLIR